MKSMRKLATVALLAVTVAVLVPGVASATEPYPGQTEVFPVDPAGILPDVCFQADVRHSLATVVGPPLADSGSVLRPLVSSSSCSVTAAVAADRRPGDRSVWTTVERNSPLAVGETTKTSGTSSTNDTARVGAGFSTTSDRLIGPLSTTDGSESSSRSVSTTTTSGPPITAPNQPSVDLVIGAHGPGPVDGERFGSAGRVLVW